MRVILTSTHLRIDVWPHWFKRHTVSLVAALHLIDFDNFITFLASRARCLQMQAVSRTLIDLSFLHSSNSRPWTFNWMRHLGLFLFPCWCSLTSLRQFVSFHSLWWAKTCFGAMSWRLFLQFSCWNSKVCCRSFKFRLLGSANFTHFHFAWAFLRWGCYATLVQFTPMASSTEGFWMFSYHMRFSFRLIWTWAISFTLIVKRLSWSILFQHLSPYLFLSAFIGQLEIHAFLQVFDVVLVSRVSFKLRFWRWSTKSLEFVHLLDQVLEAILFALVIKGVLQNLFGDFLDFMAIFEFKPIKVIWKTVYVVIWWFLHQTCCVSDLDVVNSTLSWRCQSGGFLCFQTEWIKNLHNFFNELYFLLEFLLGPLLLLYYFWIIRFLNIVLEAAVLSMERFLFEFFCQPFSSLKILDVGAQIERQKTVGSFLRCLGVRW